MRYRLWAVVVIFLFVVVVCGVLTSAFERIADSYAQSQAAYWNGRSQYVLAEAGANALEADTRAAHSMDGKDWLAVGLIVSALVIVWQGQQRVQPSACLPITMDCSMIAPQRKNTHMGD